MSLARMIYVTALLAGWAAFFGWLVCEFLVLRAGEGKAWAVVAVAAAVGGAIGSGVGAAAGLSEGNWRRAAVRAGFGLLGGFVGGLLGGLAGQLLYSVGVPRAVGWTLMGLGIGATDGLIQRSALKARDGLIGGALGGLAGGLLFDPISSALAAGTGAASRATGFVLMGLLIGALIGVVQVILRDAWVTVVDGFRTGRQLILTRPVTVMGRSELAHLPFLGPFGAPLEVEHARIERRADGRFVLVDNNTPNGTAVNRQPITGSVVLNDGDVIRIGANYIRFNEQVRRKERSEPRPAAPVKAKPAILDLPDLLESPPPKPTPAPPAPVAVRATAPVPPPAAPLAALPAPPRPTVPAPAAPAAAPTNTDACPYCRSARGHPGPRGGRYCMIHDKTY